VVEAIARRLLSGLAVLPIALALVFAMLRITGNPIESSLGDRLSEEELARRLEIAGLNKPLHEQFFNYIQSILTWDFGQSFKNLSVNDLIWKHLTATVEVATFGLALLGTTFIILGSIAAWSAGSVVDKAIRALAIVSFSLPTFFAAVLLQIAFRALLPEAEITGRVPLRDLIRWQTDLYQTGFVTLDAILAGDSTLFLTAISHMVLPAVALAFLSGTLIRVFRDSLLRELSSEPIQSARLRGVPDRRLFFRHAFIPALPAALATYGITVGSLVTGVVFVERVFEIRGLGYLLVDAVLGRDFMVVQGIFIVTFLIVALINVCVDFIILFIDKRQKEVIL
jgi:peptide/nickel transport system permease protein